MPVILVCPSCNQPLELSKDSVAECNHCHKPLPEGLMAAAKNAVRPAKPVLLYLAPWLSGFTTFLAVMAVVLLFVL